MQSYVIKNVNLFQNDELKGDVCLGIEQGKVAFIENAIPQAWQSAHQIDGKQSLLTPGLIDCHTHLVYGGNRSQEFEWRLNGETYQSIALKGGGIKSTVQATRAESFDNLFQQAKRRLHIMMRQGALRFEIKSGYGLDLETEIKMLKVARALSADLNVPIATTFLGAHTLPLEYQHDADGYIDYVCDEVMPLIKAQNLADAVDVFCESIGFNLKQTQRIFDAAKSLSLPIKCHAEQLSNIGGSHLAAKYQALSCDHVEHIDEASVIEMANNNVVAVLLPGAFYFLKETQKPPIDLFRKHNVLMAIATDHNPGSSPALSLPLMMNMACVLFGLTVQEAWQAVTVNAARALSCQPPTVTVGQDADFVLWPFSHPVEMVYNIGHFESPRVFLRGRDLQAGRED